jgi:hypothetical protein
MLGRPLGTEFLRMRAKRVTGTTDDPMLKIERYSFDMEISGCSLI